MSIDIAKYSREARLRTESGNEPGRILSGEKIKCPTPVAILLCTYNSEKYLREQLDSLLAQDFRDWTLYICDDGSSDGTRMIIDEYTTGFPNIIYVNDRESGRGPMAGFMWLLSKIESSYYMFCDHDDLWLHDKISQSLAAMQRAEATHGALPVVINTDLRIVDDRIRTIAPSLWNYAGLNPRLLTDIDYLSVCNFVTGCTMMINHTAASTSFPVGERAAMHDSWITLRALAAGGVLFPLERQTILYRLHGNNTVGIDKFGSGYITAKIRTIGTVLRKNIDHYKMINSVRPISPMRYLRLKAKYMIGRRAV